MCITFMYVSSPENAFKDKYKVILIMNRDEFFKRPTSRCDWQDDILAGRDQEPGKEGGTWLAINRQGHIGFLTNIYASKVDPGAAGRGFLVINALKADASKYLKDLAASQVQYSPFNLVLLEPQNGAYNLHYYCRGGLQSYGPFQLEPGFHGLSNHPKAHPYQKTNYGLEKMQQIVENFQHDEHFIDKLFELMKDSTSHFPDDQMSKQGSSSSMEKFHSKLACINVNISERGYGTRVTTLILIDQENNVKVIEKDAQTDENIVHQFQI